MNFTIEKTKSGKPCVIYNDQKFRHHRILKNGDVSWRCLGKNCGATIKTDPNFKNLTVGNDKHTGPHPVTMRHLLSPRGSSSPGVSTPALPAASLSDKTLPPVASTPVVTAAFSIPSLTPTVSSPVSSSPASLSPTSPSVAALSIVRTRISQPSSPVHVLHTEQKSEEVDLVAENAALKDKICELKEQLQNVIDHTIDNDKRLLQYTDQIFVANSPRPFVTTRAYRAECGIQCELPVACTDELCVEARELVSSLRTTVEVLEAELKCLKGSMASLECGVGGGEVEWTVQRGRRSPLPLETTNSRTGLPEELSLLASSTAIHIAGDSHSRDVVDLVRCMVTADTTVKGVCRPGAGLLSVTSDSPLPPDSCYVIIAGTNDVAIGQQRNIYTHLERCITSKLRTAKVVVSTLPHRHDLPAQHPINRETSLILHSLHRGALREAEWSGGGGFQPYRKGCIHEPWDASKASV
ncbi:hypothetical protein J6590_040108 [Homalodisca vitripennis]|nr:hypothetical protein J6590_040108 [Homalodisca vitripennis]